MKNSKFLSCLSDGSTYAGIREQEIVYCCYIEYGLQTTRFLDIKHLRYMNADGALAAIETAICQHLEVILTLVGHL